MCVCVRVCVRVCVYVCVCVCVSEGVTVLHIFFLFSSLFAGIQPLPLPALNHANFHLPAIFLFSSALLNLSNNSYDE